MEQAANWIAPIATTIAAIMVAANLGSKLTGYGFIVFSVGSIGWMAVGWYNDQANLIWQNAILLAINLIGVWRWLGLRARYEKGAHMAAEQSAEPGRG
jgi:hypothetical protein